MSADDRDFPASPTAPRHFNQPLPQPGVEDKCGECSHRFGGHYSSFDGQTSGCPYDDDQREGRCTCKGFSVVYRWQPTAAGGFQFGVNGR